MIKVTSNKGHIEIEMGGNLDDIRTEFTQLCINLAGEIGKKLEECGAPEGQGARHLFASLVTTFVATEADMLNPAVLIMNRDKIAEFCKKTEDYINDAINDFNSDTVEELKIESLADLFGNLFGVNVKLEVEKPETAEPAEETAETETEKE